MVSKYGWSGPHDWKAPEEPGKPWGSNPPQYGPPIGPPPWAMFLGLLLVSIAWALIRTYWS